MVQTENQTGFTQRGRTYMTDRVATQETRPIRIDVPQQHTERESSTGPTYFAFELPHTSQEDRSRKDEHYAQALMSRLNTLRYWTTVIDDVISDPQPDSSQNEVIMGATSALVDANNRFHNLLNLDVNIARLRKLDINGPAFTVRLNEVIDGNFSSEEREIIRVEALKIGERGNIAGELEYIRDQAVSGIHEQEKDIVEDAFQDAYNGRYGTVVSIPLYVGLSSPLAQSSTESSSDMEIKDQQGKNPYEVYFEELKKNFNIIQHDIQQPVTSIKGLYQMIQLQTRRGNADPLKIEEMRQGIFSACRRVGQVIESTSETLLGETEEKNFSIVEVLNILDANIKEFKDQRRGLGDISIDLQKFSPELHNMQPKWSVHLAQGSMHNILSNALKSGAQKVDISLRIKKDKDGNIIRNSFGKPTLQIVCGDDGSGFKDKRILKEGFKYSVGGWSTNAISTARGMAYYAEKTQERGGNVFGADVDEKGNLIYGDPLPEPEGRIIGGAQVIELLAEELLPLAA